MQSGVLKLIKTRSMHKRTAMTRRNKSTVGICKLGKFNTVISPIMRVLITRIGYNAIDL
jgi:hypothetical protein